MARPRATRSDRADAEPEQRELQVVQRRGRRPPEQHPGREQQPPHQQQQQQQQPRMRRFEIRKSATVGLVFPQNLRLAVCAVDADPDAGVAGHGHGPRHPFPGVDRPPDFLTSEMKWWKVKCMLPPTLEIFPPAQLLHQDPVDVGTHDRRYPLATIKYPGWQGVSRMHIDMTLYSMTHDIYYQSAHPSAGDVEMRSRWTVDRVAYTRDYKLYCIGHASPSTRAHTFRWRSGRRTAALPELADGYPLASGNLQLEDPDGKLLAVYKQRRDWDVLGALTLFDDALEHCSGMTTNAIVASCLAIVLYERVGWQNLLGD